MKWYTILWENYKKLNKMKELKIGINNILLSVYLEDSIIEVHTIISKVKFQ